MRKIYWILLGIFSMGLIFLVSYYWDSISWSWLINMLFVTDKNKFNWTGIASILAIAGLIFNFWDSRRKVRADLVSKSRINWMLTVREKYADYLTLVYEVAQDVINLKKMLPRDTKNQERFNYIKNRLDDRNVKLQNNYNFLLLYITENSNEKLYGPIVDLHYEIAQMVHELYLELNPNINDISDQRYSGIYPCKPEKIEIFQLINIAIKSASEYFKNEWEKAKQGK